MNLVIGKNGFIASQLIRRGSYISTSSNKDKESVYFDLAIPSSFNYNIIDRGTNIVLLAAISSPDACSNDYDTAYKINVIGTKYFIKEAIERGAKVLFFSSDVVYGNTCKVVDEHSDTNPSGPYAHMKDEVEKAFVDEKNFKVFRLSYVISKNDRYLKYLLQCIKTNSIAEVFHPFYRNAVYIGDVLDAIEAIIERWDDYDNQKFNICGNESISRKDIAEYINHETDGRLKYTIIEPDDEFWNARPKDINISSIYLEGLIARETTKTKDALKSILKDGV